MPGLCRSITTSQTEPATSVSCFDTLGPAGTAGPSAPNADSWGQQTAHSGTYLSHARQIVQAHNSTSPLTWFLHPGSASYSSKQLLSPGGHRTYPTSQHEASSPALPRPSPNNHREARAAVLTVPSPDQPESPHHCSQGSIV